MKKQKIFSILSLLGGVYLIWLGVSYIQHSKTEPVDVVEVAEAFERQFSAVTVKRRPPQIADVEFLNDEGQEISFKDFEGQHLLVNFWATWCAPCVIELPSLGKLSQKLDGEEIKVIAISLDMQRSQDEIKTFLSNRSIGGFAAFHDHQKAVQKKIRMRGIPTSFLINPNGQITHIFEGDANWASPSALTFFNNVLNRK